MKRTEKQLPPVGSWVKCISNDAIRYVTKHNGSYFEDDGVMSKLSPSPYCRIEYYELFIAI